MVQLEVLIGEKWLPVVRYDMAHGQPHIDRYEAPMRKTTEPLQLPPGAAMTLADADINENWERYRDTYVGGSGR